MKYLHNSEILKNIVKNFIKPKDMLFCREYINYDKIDKNKRKKEDLIKTMKKGCDILDELGVEYWLGRGSVLGFYRDNDFLPNDIDIDIDVISDEKIYQIIRKMPFDDLFITVSKGRYQQYAFLDKETNVVFDIWFYHKNSESFKNQNLFGYFNLPLDINNKITMFSFEGEDYPIPEPEWYCEFWYGKNWRIPKKYGKNWTIHYRKDCEGFTYRGGKNATYETYF